MKLNQWAKEKVKSIAINKNIRKSYKSEIKGLGSMVTQNGLYGTLAFYLVKDSNKPAAESIRNQIAELLQDRLDITNINDFPELNNDVYLRAQELVLDAISWLRRYADIFIEDDNSG